MELLCSGQSSLLVTRQEGRIVGIHFEELLDPKTGNSRVRGVDVSADAYRHALALQDRIFPEDLADPERLARIAAAAGLTPEAPRARYAPR